MIHTLFQIGRYADVLFPMFVSFELALFQFRDVSFDSRGLLFIENR